MSFLGTDKFPAEGEYAAFLAAHGGSSNAYTDTEDTCYFFDVSAPYLGGALERFARFFVAPSFTASATARELNAIDAENAKNLQSDSFRLYQLDKSFARAEHPYSKFATGNKATLVDGPARDGIDTRAALLAFWEENYTAERMALAVVAPESLDSLQARVASLFSPVRSAVPARPQWIQAAAPSKSTKAAGGWSRRQSAPAPGTQSAAALRSSAGAARAQRKPTVEARS